MENQNYDKEKNIKNMSSKSYGEKTMGLRIINVLQLISLIIIGIISFSSKQEGKGFIYILIGVVAYFLIKGISDIIDMLYDINNKIK